jgi:hypothetical protein
MNLDSQIQTMYQSIARWPKPEQGGPSLGNTHNESVDTHGTMAEAAAVCHKLRTFGFGGDCKIYPLSTQVVQVIEADPHFRIGQLEGAIKGALPYFEEMTGHTEYLTRSEGDMPYATERAAEARQVITSLKQLIEEKE